MNVINNMNDVDELKLVLEQMSNYLTEFLGFEYEIKFDVKNVDNQKANIEIIQESKKFLIPYVQENYSRVFETINFELDRFLSAQKTYVGDIGYFINKIAILLIFNDFSQGTEIKKNKTYNFIKTLQDISNMTYESEPVKMGIYYCQSDKDLELLKSNENFEYIQFDVCELKEFIRSQKPLLKLIDNKSFSIVTNSNFEVVGIIKRNFGSKPILNVMNNIILNREKYLFINDLINEIKYMTEYQFGDDFCDKYCKVINKLKKTVSKQELDAEEYLIKNKKDINKLFNTYSDYIIELLEKEKLKINEELIKYNEDDINIIYITIQNREIEFWFNDYFSICEKNSNWKIKNYVSLAHECFSSIVLNPNYLITDKIDAVTGELWKVKELNIKLKDKTKQIIEEEIANIKDISTKIFKLIDNIKKLSTCNEGALFIIIDQECFNKEKDNLIENNEISNNYKKIIKNNDFEQCITMINDDTFQLIATVDGATLLDSDFKIISFSEMIKTQTFDKSKCGKIYGARTNAAVNASKFGTAIKVSEDGDITVYRKVKYRGMNDEDIIQVEKVLSI